MCAWSAIVVNESDRGRLVSLTDDDLPEGDVTVRVAYSSLNYKDGLILSGLGRSAGACLALGVPCQLLEFVVAPRVAEHDFMPGSCKDRAEFGAHQART